MAIVQTYEVIEVRRLEVVANSPEDAMKIGAARLDGKEHDRSKIQGTVTRVPRVISLEVKEI